MKFIFLRTSPLIFYKTYKWSISKNCNFTVIFHQPQRLVGVSGGLLAERVLKDLLAIDLLLDRAAGDQTIDDDRMLLSDTICSEAQKKTPIKETLDHFFICLFISSQCCCLIRTLLSSTPLSFSPIFCNPRYLPSSHYSVEAISEILVFCKRKKSLENPKKPTGLLEFNRRELNHEVPGEKRTTKKIRESLQDDSGLAHLSAR